MESYNINSTSGPVSSPVIPDVVSEDILLEVSESSAETNLDEPELLLHQKKKKKDAMPEDLQYSGYVPFQKVKPDLVQIKAGTANVMQRIKCFQARKRDEVNTENVNEFCYDAVRRQDQGCARVDAMVQKRSDCKSHIKVYRVFNAWGPQTRGVDPGSIPHPNPPDPAYRLLREREESLIDKVCGTCGHLLTNNCPDAVNERLENAELHLKIDGPVPKDVYLRIKQIENRIMQLEGISPEYANKSADCPLKDGSPLEYSPLNKRGYSKYELKRRLTLLQNDLIVKRLKRGEEKPKRYDSIEIKKEVTE